MTKTDEDSQDDNDFWGTSTSPVPEALSGYIVSLNDYEGESQIGDNEDDLPPNVPVVGLEVKRNRLFRPLPIIGSGIMLIGLTMLANFVIHLIKHHHVLAVPIGIGAALIVYGLAWISFGELRAISRLKNAERLQAEILRLSSADISWKEAAAVVQHLPKAGSTAVRQSFVALNGVMKSNHSGAYYFPEFEKIVLGVMDKEAEEAIVRAVRDTFFLTILAQTPIIDTAAFTLRALLLLREIALSYGARPGPMARVRIMIAALKNVATISLTDIVVTDMLAAAGTGIEAAVDLGTVVITAAGGGLVAGAAGNTVKHIGKAVGVIAEKVAADITVGAVSGRRMALFGFLIVETCRPIRLSRGRRKKMGEAVKNQLSELIKGARKKK
jgi:uncharacterized membrane protein YcjF (UPF0283 family)